MVSARKVLRAILEESPSSIRALAQAAGLSEGLLRAIRDGRARMTVETRKRLVKALTERAEIHTRHAEELEAAELEPGGRDG